MLNKNVEDKSIVRLEEVDNLLFETRQPFNFRYTFWKPSHFDTGLEMHSPPVSWRSFRFGSTLCGVRFEMKEKKLAARVFAAGDWNTEIRSRLIRRINLAYGLSEDISTFLSLAASVTEMRSPLRILKGMRMSCPESLFEIAVVSLLLQNTTIQRTTQMMTKLLNRYGSLVEFDNVYLRVFFSPEQMLPITENELRVECRLGYRAKYLPEFAKFFSVEDDDALRELPQETIMSNIQKIKGVGPYTAGIIASHALRDPSKLALDVWNTKLFAKIFSWEEGLEAKIVLEKFEKLFPNYEGLAGLYILEHHYIDTPMLPLVDEQSLVEFNSKLKQSYEEV